MPQLSGLPLYYQNPVGRLYEHPDGYVIIDYNPGRRTRLEYQAFLHHLENLLKLRHTNKMLADQRQMTPFTPEEETWIRQQWLGVSHALQDEMIAAVLMPDDVFARLAMNNMLQTAREGALVYRIFNDATDAAAWLKQLPTP